VEAVAGARLVRDRIVYRELDGARKDLDYENIHHRNETVGGLTDPQIMVRRGLSIDAWDLAVSGRLGASLPVGFISADPYRAALRGQPHQHIQLGTGTFNLIAGAEAKLEFHTPVNGSLEAFAQALIIPTGNAEGYRAGNRYTAGAMFAWKPTFTGPILRLGVIGFREQPEVWATTPSAEEGNLGRTDLLLDFGAIWRLGGDWSASVSIRAPLISQIAGAQFEYPGIAELSAARLLHLHGAETVD
jgi:hypothetical protein